MNKEVKLLTNDQVEDIVESLKIDIVKNDSRKEDHVMRKYYNICEVFREVKPMQTFVKYLEQHPTESKRFILLLWNGLVDSCENVLATYKNPDEYRIDAVHTDSKNNKYAHVLNDLLSSMLEENGYWDIQKEALSYAVDELNRRGEVNE